MEEFRAHDCARLLVPKREEGEGERTSGVHPQELEATLCTKFKDLLHCGLV
jgi:hypothetical protein